MIDYSVYVQANPIKDDEPAKAYAKAQMKELLSFKKFVQHISDHNGVYTRGTVRGVLLDMCECLVEMLLEGKKVQLGELGNFWISLTSRGAASPSDFTAENITGVNIVFTPGEDFENLIGRAEFNVVPSRKAQAKMLAAEKAGDESLSLDDILSKTRKGMVSSGYITGNNDDQP